VPAQYRLLGLTPRIYLRVYRAQSREKGADLRLRDPDLSRRNSRLRVRHRRFTR